MKKLLLLPVILAVFLPGCQNTNEVVATESQAAVNPLHAALQAAATGAHRSEKNIARNQYRHPVETLEFFGLQPGMSVLEITPGGLWYTEVLAPAMKGNGQFTVAGYDISAPKQPEYRLRQQQHMEKLFSDHPELYGEVNIVKFSPPATIELGEANSMDMVVTFRNTHNWIRFDFATDVYAAFYEVLKPGGILGVVQHRAVSAETENPKTGYISEQTLIELATGAGFVLDARSEINANPKDTHDHPMGVWTLPPILRGDEEDREKYLAIGESDRMTLRFRKP